MTSGTPPVKCAGSAGGGGGGGRGVEDRGQLVGQRPALDEAPVERRGTDRERPDPELRELGDALCRIDRSGADQRQPGGVGDRLDERRDVAVVAVGEEVDPVRPLLLDAPGVFADLVDRSAYQTGMADDPAD